jgi:Lecithin retinol acyltransferase
MAKGDHIKVSGGGYEHHGIDVGDGEVVYFNGEPKRKSRTGVKKTSLFVVTLVAALVLAGTLVIPHSALAFYLVGDPKVRWPEGEGILVYWEGDDIDPQGWIPSLIRYRVENLWGRYANI